MPPFFVEVLTHQSVSELGAVTEQESMVVFLLEKGGVTVRTED